MRLAYGLTSAGLTAAALLTTPLAAQADWDATAAATVTAARAVVLPGGPVPTTVVRNSTVTVDWAAVNAGSPVRGYRVIRTDLTTGATVGAGNGCAGLRPKTNCREVAVPAGLWAYGVVAVVGAHWTSVPGFGAATTVESTVAPAVPRSGEQAGAPEPDAADQPTATPEPTDAAPSHTPDAPAPSRTPEVATPSRTPDAPAPSRTPEVATPSRTPEVVAPPSATPIAVLPSSTPTATAQPEPAAT
jgi:hypothetical protein